MARHDFGIMQNAPKPGKRYDEYEPQKYNCISVDDDYMELIDANLNNVNFYWHTLDIPAKGIAYTGITLIPPTSIQAFTAVIKDITELNELKNLLEKALAENKWVIHFGL
ncbi:MAG: hypothetical protein IJO74_00820 [Clostridia bacterium]|nr:hypothetical protein [Clostridia bacterium]